MTDCENCEYPDLCIGFRTKEDYLSPDGKYRKILGCNPERYFFGDELTSGCNGGKEWG